MATMTKKLWISSTQSNGAKYQDGFVMEMCCSCGVVFAMTDGMHQQRKSDGKMFYCTNGHGQHYTETDAVRFRKLKEDSERDKARLRNQLNGALDDAQHQRRIASAARGQLTKARNRAAAGVCPSPGCKRSFHSLAEHVRNEHPDLLDGLPDA